MIYQVKHRRHFMFYFGPAHVAQAYVTLYSPLHGPKGSPYRAKDDLVFADDLVRAAVSGSKSPLSSRVRTNGREEWVGERQGVGLRKCVPLGICGY